MRQGITIRAPRAIVPLAVTSAIRFALTWLAVRWLRRPTSTPVGRRRVLAASLVLLCLAAWPGRHLLLEGVGRTLVAEDQLTAAAAIVLPSSGDAFALLEAAALAAHFPAASVVLFDVDAPELVEAFARRGLTFPSSAGRSAELLEGLGISRARLITLRPDQGGTRGEMAAVAVWAARARLGSVVVVSNWHHSARTKRTLRRALSDTGIASYVRLPPSDRAAARMWWQARSGRRMALVELQKLMLDFAAHPLN